ncbi:MAG: hypothetical protein JWM78_513 [Verrucomicrobiaceae bacterium]|nr:hypothetical protein [Verrucomicrobiaceae bacterium]
MQQAQVSGLAIYPVKSLGGIALKTLPIDLLGPEWDRRFMLVDAKRRFITQRQFPRLCLISVALQAGQFSITAAGHMTLTLEVSVAASATWDVTVWHDVVAACDMGEKAATWFSNYLGCEVRLVYLPESSVRAVDPVYAQANDRVGFADGFPILLTTQASLDEINRELPGPISMQRFRPNIVIDGTLPYAEDSWRRVRIGALEFEVVKPCSRCAIPSINPQTGQKQPIVAQTLSRLRSRDNAVYFGQNLIHRGHGRIALGDRLTVLE